MIVTLTPNPSVDRTVLVDALTRGAVHRGTESWAEPSGKGVNVSLALHLHDMATTAVLPIGGPAGAELSRMLRDAGLPHRAVPISGEVRGNVSVLEPDGTATKINQPGPRLEPTEIDVLLRTALDTADGARWLAGCGSLPAGVDDDLYAVLVREAHRRGVPVVVDTSGVPLREAVRAGVDLVAPNADELAEAVGGVVSTFRDVLEAAQVLRSQGARAVLTTLGPDGALLVDDDGAVLGAAPPVPIVSTVGAGDALLAGHLGAGGRGETALAAGLRWAAAAVQERGTLLTGARIADVPVHLTRDLPRGPLTGAAG